MKCFLMNCIFVIQKSLGTIIVVLLIKVIFCRFTNKYSVFSPDCGDKIRTTCFHVSLNNIFYLQQKFHCCDCDKFSISNLYISLRIVSLRNLSKRLFLNISLNKNTEDISLIKFSLVC